MKHSLGHMRQKRQRLRLQLIMAGLVLAASIIGLILWALQDTIIFFHGPTAIAKGEVPINQTFRLGGLVKENSVIYKSDKDNQSAAPEIQFIITDSIHEVIVSYKGILPDLFREGQGIVAMGTLNHQNLFIADQILAKHDENYMPPEAVEAMKQAGTWQGGESN